MTSLPADMLGLYDRGRIAPGMATNLVIFDPDKIQDTATFAKPAAYPTGIDAVLVNGTVASRPRKEHRGKKWPGEVLFHASFMQQKAAQ